VIEGRNHYSYTVYADPGTARAFDERRFGGPIGELVARGQADLLERFLHPVSGRSIIDVGTGTGRAAFLLSARGAEVTGVDASEEMLGVARRRAEEEGVRVRFEAGDAHALPFADRSFDVAVCLRVLMHTPRWDVCVNELCRVARAQVLVDYPSARSTALLQSVWRRVLHAAGTRTEPYRVFFDRDIAAAFGRNGFQVRSAERQFVLPIAVHKAIGSPAFTTTVERWLRRLGLLACFGSPVTVVAERCASS
jgi:2-polyprenyl-3-methyl-5-hydroxy-6-metoxy-1,4-benzoquinol methylase